jgi:glycosyltransferase involved in cell wall biosynthesis
VITRPLHVLQIVKGLDIGGYNGGAENFGLALARQLHLAGDRVSLCAFYRYSTPVEEHIRRQLEEQGISVLFASATPRTAFFHSARAISRYIRENQVTLLHSHVQIGTLSAITLKPFHPLRLVRTAHTPLEFGTGLAGRVSRALFVPFVYPLALDAEVGVSTAIVDSLNRRWLAHLRRASARCIYNAIPPSSTETGDADPFSAYHSDPGPDPWIITTIGILNRFKSFDTLIRALPLLLQEIPHARVAVVGAGPMLEEYRRLAEQIGVSHAVWFLGQRRDIPAILRHSQVFVQPSRREGLSTVILEAMQQGTPVIASDIPGSRELIQDGVTGALFPVGSPVALAEKLLTLYGDHSSGAGWAANASATLAKFDIQAAASAYHALYRDLLA